MHKTDYHRETIFLVLSMTRDISEKTTSNSSPSNAGVRALGLQTIYHDQVSVCNTMQRRITHLWKEDCAVSDTKQNINFMWQQKSRLPNALQVLCDMISQLNRDSKILQTRNVWPGLPPLKQIADWIACTMQLQRHHMLMRTLKSCGNSPHHKRCQSRMLIANVRCVAIHAVGHLL